jgi:pimeloyl-ACP methyl ester carboxylesterase
MTMQGWAGDCIALLNHLGIASAHVAGHSFGAGIALQMAIDARGRVRKPALLEPPLLSLVPSGGQFAEWMATVREIYDSGDKAAATDMVLAGAYGQDYRRFTDGALPASRRGGIRQAVHLESRPACAPQAWCAAQPL